MSRRKWAVFALVQVFILAIMVSGQKLQLWDARVQRAGWFLPGAYLCDAGDNHHAVL